jgi:hypothetical protein
MNRVELWWIKLIIAKEVAQGFDHAKKIESLYGLIREACEHEFVEDSAPSLDAFLRERFEATQYLTERKGRG